MAKTTPEQLYAMRHSLAHIMADAVGTIWPHAKFGVGPVVENGFYYDIDLGETPVSEADFKRIEKEMRKIIKGNAPFERSEKPIAKAIAWAKETKQPYKEELLNDLKRAGTTVAKDLDAAELGLEATGGSKVEKVSFYTNDRFTDLCRGPHVESTGMVGAFKLMRVAGAYWRGKDTNPQMQRLYGVAFDTQDELDAYLTVLEEAKRRDHRKLGQELDLFVFSDLVGPGLPLFTPRGAVLRTELERFSQELQAEAGYERVWIPHITRSELYKVSGHYDKYPERFEVTSVESDDTFMMKPMNCPHHTQIYASKQRSYRDLPIRYMENTTNYRDEKSGELHGLSRVRALTQDDGHVFCTIDHIGQEMRAIMEMISQMYSIFNMDWYARLSFRDDSDKYLGDPSAWEQAEEIIESVAKELQLNYVIGKGEAAFYGPKIDIMVRDALGREWQCATEQLDFVQPQRFGLAYTDSDGQQKTPVMIHKALLGSVERFLSVYIEHTAGRFPVWLAPEQLRLITVNQTDDIVAYADTLAQQAKQLGIRVFVDNGNESVGKKIRSAEQMKIPYTVVVGEKELETGATTPRVRSDMVVQMITPIKLENLFKTIANEAKSRTAHTTI